MSGLLAVCSKIESLPLREALKLVIHRGRDDAGAWQSPDKRVWLGATRMAITDFSQSGRLPLKNESGTIWLIADGSVTNYNSLRRRLELKGHRFISSNDSEVIIHAYEMWNESCLDYLEGAFSFILWDTKARQLIASRDRAGVKPMYYTEHEGGVFVSSEPAPLLRLLPETPQPNPLAAAYMMTLGYIPSPETIWRGIRKLEPGQLLGWSARSGVRLRRYWEPPRITLKRNRPDQFGEIIEEIVGRSMMADKTVNFVMPDGIDGTTLATVINKLGHQPETLTLTGLNGSGKGDKSASKYASALEFPHASESISAQRTEADLRNALTHYYEPTAHSQIIRMMEMGSIFAKSSQLMISYQGSDPIFWGSRWYHKNRSSGGFFGRLRSPEGPAVRRFTNISPIADHVWRTHNRFLPAEAAEIIAPSNIPFTAERMLKSHRRYYVEKLPMQRNLQRIDMMTYYADCLFPMLDKASMANSVELRLPFADRRLIEWSLALAWDKKESQIPKFLMREFLAEAKQEVPESNIYTDDEGFTELPLDISPHQMIDTIQKSYWVEEGYWSPEWQNIADKPSPNRQARLWNLYILSLWVEIWYKEQPWAN